MMHDIHEAVVLLRIIGGCLIYCTGWLAYNIVRDVIRAVRRR